MSSTETLLLRNTTRTESAKSKKSKDLRMNRTKNCNSGRITKSSLLKIVLKSRDKKASLTTTLKVIARIETIVHPRTTRPRLRARKSIRMRLSEKQASNSRPKSQPLRAPSKRSRFNPRLRKRASKRLL